MINQLFQDLAAIPQVEAIALGGSRSGTHYDEKSDYDIYLYCTGPITEQQRRDILSKYCSYVEYGNHFWELEDNGTLNNGIDFDLLYRNLDSFVADVADVVEAHHARNGYTTCMWHNLLTCKMIYDRDGRLAAAKSRFDVPYPEELRKNIICRNRKLLSDMMPSYDGQIRKAISRNDLVSINHRTSAFLESYFDIIFALNRKTHPGEKRLISLCKAGCPVLPRDFEKNLLCLFKSMYVDPDMSTEAVRRIVEEIDNIL
jgi:hypothetical protein